MTASEALRQSCIDLAHGSGAMPAVGFGTLIPDLVGDQAGHHDRLGSRLPALRLRRTVSAMNKRWAMPCARSSTREPLRGSDVFVTTKLWNTNHRPERVTAGIRQQVAERLHIDYRRLLPHPYALRVRARRRSRSRATSMVSVIYDDGVTLRRDVAGARAPRRRRSTAGRSAYRTSTLEQLRELVAVARIKPAVVQVESHPYLPEWELLDFCREHGIVLLAFAPLGHSHGPATSWTTQ